MFFKPPAYHTARTIGTGQSNEGDVRRLRSALRRIGYGNFPTPGAPNITPGLMDAIKRFQADFGLEPDAIIRPGGPTERALSMALHARNQEGEAAIRELRNAFGRRARAGLAFRPHPEDREAGLWTDDAGGRTLSDAEADAFTAEVARPAVPSPDAARLAYAFRGFPREGMGTTAIEGADGRNDLAAATHSEARRGLHRNPVSPEIAARRARVNALPRPTGVLKAEHAPEEFLDRVEGYNRRHYVEDWRRRGWHYAADNLERYLDGSGETLEFAREEARSFRPIREAEAENKSRIENRTLLGRTDNRKFNEKLRSVGDGKSIDLQDDWNSAYNGPRAFAGAVGAMAGEQDFYRAFGRTAVTSKTVLRATRKRDIIHFDGTVTYTWDDKYDFAAGQPGSGDARALERSGRARPFKFGATWKQRLRGTVRRLPNGELTEPRVEWTDLDE